MSDLVEVVRSAMPAREEEWGQVDPDVIADAVLAYTASTLTRPVREGVTAEDVHRAWAGSNVSRGLELSPSLAEAFAGRLTELLRLKGEL